MKKTVTVRHHHDFLINHGKGHSLALNSHNSKKYLGIHGLKYVIYILTMIPRYPIHGSSDAESPYFDSTAGTRDSCELVNEFDLGIGLERVSM